MRTKFLVLSALFISALLLSPQTGSAQFVNGKVFLGPSIGLSVVGSQPVFGAYFETPVTQPGKLGPGILGVAGRLDYWSWSSGFDSWTWITIAAIANYHFALEDKTWDPFVGVGLGYEHISWSYAGSTFGYGNLYPGGIFFTVQAGARYFISPNFALRALLGIGISYIDVGVDFGL